MSENPDTSDIPEADESFFSAAKLRLPVGGDLTLEEKTRYAEMRAREEEAEKHFFDKAQPFYPLGFSVGYRNHGHWDIYAEQVPGKASAWKHAHPTGTTSARDGGKERAFRIRGEPGQVTVYDERWNPHRPYPRGSMTFHSVMGAMLWIAEELMQQPKTGETK